MAFYTECEFSLIEPLLSFFFFPSFGDRSVVVTVGRSCDDGESVRA